MNHKGIAGTDLLCSALCLGGGVLGGSLNQEDSFRLMDLYVDEGGNFIDTAEVYANWLPIEPSISEKTIGKWMKARKNRQQMIVTTKGAHPRLETMHIPRMSKADIRLDVEGSLRNLQVDAIDLYWLHRDDANLPVGEILETLNEQVEAGSIRYFGCSNWITERIHEAQKYAKEHGVQGFSGNQMMWSLASADRTKFTDPTLVAMDGEMKQFHLTTGLSAVPYSSQAQGLFTKWDTESYSLEDERINPIYRSAVNLGKYQRARQLAFELSLTVTQVALGYLISHPFPTFPVIGCRTPDQLEESLKAADVQLNVEQLDFLENGIVAQK